MPVRLEKILPWEGDVHGCPSDNRHRHDIGAERSDTMRQHQAAFAYEGRWGNVCSPHPPQTPAVCSRHEVWHDKH